MSLLQLHFRQKHAVMKNPWQTSRLFCGRWNKLGETAFFFFLYIGCILSWNKNTLPLFTIWCFSWAHFCLALFGIFHYFWTTLGLSDPVLWLTASECVTVLQVFDCLSQSCSCIRLIKAKTGSLSFVFIGLAGARKEAGKGRQNCGGVVAAHRLWFMQFSCCLLYSYIEPLSSC